jgi:hypothetical protein
LTKMTLWYAFRSRHLDFNSSIIQEKLTDLLKYKYLASHMKLKDDEQIHQKLICMRDNKHD